MTFAGTCSSASFSSCENVAVLSTGGASLATFPHVLINLQCIPLLRTVFYSVLLIVVWKDEEGLDVVREHHLECDGRGESPLSMDAPRRCLGLRLPESRAAFSSCWDLPS